MVKGTPARRSCIAEITTLGEVPICVIRPPNKEPNAMGIKKRREKPENDEQIGKQSAA